MRVQHLRVELSKLHPGLENPRRVKPTAEANQQLVASVRAYGLLQQLLIRPMPDHDGEYQVIAGNRRLAALRQVYKRSEDDPKIRCELRDVDDVTAEALALSENFIREHMHPLDEAEAFAHLAADEAQGVDAIGSAFGVTERYVRQRMRLAGLAKVVKTALRQNEIDIATAEAFASIPQDRQMVIWEEMNGHPRHAEHVRNIINHDWIDAKHALFDLSAVPETSVSRDLFSERVLVERSAFMAAQIEALAVEKTSFIEAGWKEVVAGRYEDVQDQPLAMDTPPREYDAEATRKFEKIAVRRQRWEAKLDAVPIKDDKALTRIQEKLEALDAEEQEIEHNALVFYSDATRATAKAFLMLYPDGQVRREYRVPRRKGRHANGDRDHGTEANGTMVEPGQQPVSLNSDDLSDRQLADTFAHQTLMVREALLDNGLARKRVLALMLHDKVRAEALAVRREPNATTLHVERAEGFTSPAFDRLQAAQAKVDPFATERSLDDRTAYERLAKLKPAKLDALIDLLIVQCLTAHPLRPTGLVHNLATELKVDVRASWMPDATWLAGFQKVQLGHLITELMGSLHAPSPDRKKSELVDALAKLFASAADGTLEDKQLAHRVNQWLPSNLRSLRQEAEEVCHSATLA